MLHSELRRAYRTGVKVGWVNGGPTAHIGISEQGISGGGGGKVT